MPKKFDIKKAVEIGKTIVAAIGDLDLANGGFGFRKKIKQALEANSQSISIHEERIDALESANAELRAKIEELLQKDNPVNESEVTPDSELPEIFSLPKP